MHLWPSLRIRDSFKQAYLKKLEWNIHRMNSDKDSQGNQKLLGDERDVAEKGPDSKLPWILVILRELLMILSCCYCCFCCGACVDQDEN